MATRTSADIYQVLVRTAYDRARTRCKIIQWPKPPDIQTGTKWLPASFSCNIYCQRSRSAKTPHYSPVASRRMFILAHNANAPSLRGPQRQSVTDLRRPRSVLVRCSAPTDLVNHHSIRSSMTGWARLLAASSQQLSVVGGHRVHKCYATQE